jgi:beta-lactam-binding protein with PASTA domain
VAVASAFLMSCVGGTKHGPNEVVIPDVRGLPFAEAVQRVNVSGLTVTGVGIKDDCQLGQPGADEVVSQNPSPGTVLPRGTGISVTVTAMVHSQPRGYSPPC